MILRDYQNSLVGELRDGFRKQIRRQLLVLGTGGGKSVIFAFMVAEATKRGLRTMVIAHRDQILEQIESTLTKFGVPWGRVRANSEMDASKPVLVASVQTLARRLESVPIPDLIVQDEAHHLAAETWKKVFLHYPNARWVGVTATPVRGDHVGLGDYFDKMVVGPPVSWLIEQGWLKKPIYFAPAQAIDVSGIKKVAGDFAKNEIADVMDRPCITGDSVKEYLKRGKGMGAAAFVVNLKHGNAVADAFNVAGVRAELIEGKMETEERLAMKERLRSGETKVIVSCELLNEGWDLSAVGVAILLRPTLSLALHLQQLGRALRPHDGQAEAIILDAVGNIFRHGLAEEERTWSLSGRACKARTQEAILTTVQCPACFCISQTSTCPECGHVRPCKLRELRQKEGELREIEAAELAAKRARKMEEWKCRTLADWQALAKARGYKPGYAWARYSNSRHFLSKKTKPEVVV